MTFSNFCRYDINETLLCRAYTLHTPTLSYYPIAQPGLIEAGNISQQPLVPSADSHRKQSGHNVPFNEQTYCFFSAILLVIVGQLSTSGNTRVC